MTTFGLGDLHNRIAKAAGREIAAIVYVDELPEVTEDPGGGETFAGRVHTSTADASGLRSKRLRQEALGCIAIARQLIDAAAEADEDREIEALADAMDQAFVSDDIRRRVARRAWELGARPDGGTGGPRHMLDRAAERVKTIPEGSRIIPDGGAS